MISLGNPEINSYHYRKCITSKLTCSLSAWIVRTCECMACALSNNKCNLAKREGNKQLTVEFLYKLTFFVFFFFVDLLFIDKMNNSNYNSLCSESIWYAYSWRLWIKLDTKEIECVFSRVSRHECILQIEHALGNMAYLSLEMQMRTIYAVSPKHEMIMMMMGQHGTGKKDNNNNSNEIRHTLRQSKWSYQ